MRRRIDGTAPGFADESSDMSAATGYRRPRARHDAFPRTAVVLAALVAVPTAIPDPGAADAGPRSRLVRSFDFEDAERLPMTFPRPFTNLADRFGGGRLGRMALSRDEAASGRWSLLFEPDGASLGAGIPPGEIPVVPFADHRVRILVRTRDLTRGGARLAGRLHRADGSIIAASERVSPPVRAEEAWTEIAIIVPGDDPAAAHLSVDLLVTQPALLEPGRPTPPEIRGRAWFDDLTITIEPRVTLTPADATGMVDSGAGSALRLEVRDAVHESLTASLEIRDALGSVVHRLTTPCPRSGAPVDLPVPPLPPGWYEAVSRVRSIDGLLAQRAVRFTVLPAPRSRSSGTPAFAVYLTADGADPAMTAARARGLGVRDALLEIPPGAADAPETRSATALTSRTAESISRADLDPGFVLPQTPPEQAHPRIESLLTDPIFRARFWQYGAADFSTERVPSSHRIEDAERVLLGVHHDARIVHPVSVLADPEAIRAETPLAIMIPRALRPSEIPDALAPWFRRHAIDLVALESLEGTAVSPADISIDLAERMLFAWAAGAPVLAMRAPWRATGQPGTDAVTIEPTPTFAVFRGVSDVLSGRRFGGELPMEPGLRAWVALGTDAAHHALILFRDPDGGRSVDSIELPIHAGGAVDAVGAEVDLHGGRLALPHLPVFCESIDVPLARFHATARLDPPVVDAAERSRAHLLILENHWSSAITGTALLESVDGIRVDPARLSFSLLPGERAELPVHLLAERTPIAGRRRVQATVRLDGERSMPVRLSLPVEVSWPDVGLAARWRHEPDGRRAVRMLVTNRGDRAIDLEGFVIGTDYRVERRMIGRVPPGRTVQRLIPVPSTFLPPEGGAILVGIADLDGPGRIGHLLEVRSLRRDRFTAAPGDPTAPDR